MILDTIAASTLERVAATKEALPLAEQIARARDLDSNTGFPFEQALAKPGMSFICEVKKASPSKGLIAAEFPYVQIAREYEAAGADAISVLTEPAYFQGKNEYLTEIRQAVKIPLLRKDFTVDEYMIYEAKNIGANAVLLICAILSPMLLKSEPPEANPKLTFETGMMTDRKSTRLNSSHDRQSRMPSSA